MVFADTVFWVGLTRRQDQHRARALRWDVWLDTHQTRIVTTEAVLWEWLNAHSDQASRQRASEGYRYCHEDEQIEVVPFESERVQAAVALYESRTDKSWSLTDCFSFIVMQEHRLRDALTTDHHFEQAGFRALLLQDPPPRFLLIARNPMSFLPREECLQRLREQVARGRPIIGLERGSSLPIATDMIANSSWEGGGSVPGSMRLRRSRRDFAGQAELQNALLGKAA